jgi:hypothetical protein
MSLARSCKLAPAVALVGATLALALAAPAFATSPGERVILRCTHGESLRGFSQSAYRQALRELSADAEEYSSCAAQIRQAQIEAAAHHGAAAGAGGPLVALAATPSELRSLGAVKRHGSGPVSVGGELVHPGVVHASVASAFSTLPAPLLAVLALLLACLLLTGGLTLRRRVRRGHPG